MFLNWGMDTPRMVHPHNGTHLSSEREKLLICATTRLNLRCITLRERSRTQKAMLHESIYMVSGKGKAMEMKRLPGV